MKQINPRLYVLSHVKNEGVGGTMLKGYSFALKLGAEIVIKVDGDGQMDIEYIPSLIYLLENDYADYTKRNRFLHFGELRKMPFIRRFGNFSLSFLTKLASGYWNIFDPTNGYTAISRGILLNFNPYRIRHDYFFETSMLCELRSLDAVIEDVSIPAIYADEVSSLNISKELFNFSFNFLKRGIRRFYVQYFLYDFTAVSAFISFSLIFGIFGVIWGYLGWTKSVVTGIPATTGTVLIAALAIILSAQFIIQAIAIDVNSAPQRKYLKIYSPGVKNPNPKNMVDYFESRLMRGEVRIDKSKI